jgi:transposase InsO family protein
MICRTLHIGRATAYRKDRPRPRRYRRQEDEVVLAQLRQMLRERASYGYRRARRIVNREFGTCQRSPKIPQARSSKTPHPGDQLTASVAAWTMPDLSLSLRR